MSGFAVLDFETTGFGSHDRVVEVGVVLLARDGEVQGEWTTLVNPGRDVGSTDFHGIYASDVLDAPPFSEVVPLLIQSLRGRVVVAHNISFELRFLRAEMERAGVLIDNPWLTGFCTMKWGGRLLPAASRSLQDCCDAVEIVLENAHCALADARATAALVKCLLELGGTPPPWAREIHGADLFGWPEVADFPVQLAARGTVPKRRPAGWLDRIVARMPRQHDPQVEAYLEVLESALLDHYLSRHEEEALIEVAQELGLSRQVLNEIHWEYLREMARVALADDIVTDEERAALIRVAELLGMTTEHVESALMMAPVRPTRVEFTLAEGDVLCLTGEMSRPRSEWTAELQERGLAVGSLTRRTRLLVAADPDSLSGKAKKAREYGIPIINEDALIRLLRQG